MDVCEKHNAALFGGVECPQCLDETLEGLGLLLEQLEVRALVEYDGHFAILHFTTNVRVGFGTPSEREDIDKVPAFATLQEACRYALEHEPCFDRDGEWPQRIL